MRLRPARPDEAELLSDLAVRSKGHWGYDADFLAASRVVLTLTADAVVAERAVVAEVDGVVAGFYTLYGEPPAGVLNHMFVDPPYIGAGVGRALWAHAVDTAERLGLRRFTIDADPFAESFYLAMGAKPSGSSPSSVMPGRMLPQLTYWGLGR